jgi:hypothetical protein
MVEWLVCGTPAWPARRKKIDQLGDPLSVGGQLVAGRCKLTACTFVDRGGARVDGLQHRDRATPRSEPQTIKRHVADILLKLGLLTLVAKATLAAISVPDFGPGRAIAPLVHSVELAPLYGLSDSWKCGGPESPRGGTLGGGMAQSVHSAASDDVTRRGSDRHAATVLGRMYLEGILTEGEAEAGFCYAENVGAYERMRGHPPRHSQSPSFEFGRKGVDELDVEALRRRDVDVADKVERRIHRKCRAIQKQYDWLQSHVPLFPILISTVLEEVCCNDRPVHSLHHQMVKKILRTLAQKVYGLDVVEQRKPVGRRVDAVLVAKTAIRRPRVHRDQ